jgi:RNA polymerase sigma-70 factor (ECF subfamily)
MCEQLRHRANRLRRIWDENGTMSTLKHLVDKIARELQGQTTQKLQEYLLGGLRPKQRADIERRLIEDEAFFHEVLTAEDALVEDYVQRRLPSDIVARVDALLSSSSEWAKKVRFALAAKTLVDRKGQNVAPGRIAFGDAIYEELERLAKRTLRRTSGQELEPSDLVAEAYLRLAVAPQAARVSRADFLAMAATIMRRVLVDVARHERASKRGAWPTVGLSAVPDVGQDVRVEEQVLELDFALNALAGVDARQSRTVELKFFSGLTDEEIGAVLGVSTRTVKREWNAARAWLHRYLGATNTIQ